MKKTFYMLLTAAMISFSLSAEAAKPKKNSSVSKTAKSSVSASTKKASTKTTKAATKATTANFVAKTSSNSKKSSASSKNISTSENKNTSVETTTKTRENKTVAESKKSVSIVQAPQNDVANNDNVDGETIVKTAMHFIGQPYVWGATGPSSFDCSGFTRYLYKQYDINLDRCSGSQFAQGKAIHKTSDLRAGDLVFFRGRTSKGVGHVGIVVSVNPDGNSFKFVHARNRGVGVDDSKMAYYSSRYVGARRILK